MTKYSLNNIVYVGFVSHNSDLIVHKKKVNISFKVDSTYLPDIHGFILWTFIPCVLIICVGCLR